MIQAGSDAENFDVSQDGTPLFISNEDDSAVSVVDIAAGNVVKSAKMGGQPEGVKVTPWVFTTPLLTRLPPPWRWTTPLGHRLIARRENAILGEWPFE
jgi:YVTN family beta-propeller protein